MYNKTTEEVLNLVNSSDKGLSQQEAKNRLADNGKNEVKLIKNMSLSSKIKQQLNSVVMYVLIFACVISMVATIIFKNGFMLMNLILIFVAMVLNVVVAIVTLSKLEKTLIKVDNKLKPYTTVKRDGKLVKVKTCDIVVGDIIYVNEGDVVPADVRIIKSNDLYINDLLITGETTSIKKTDAIINEANLPLGEQNNMAFLGSNVTKGSGFCIVVNTGLNTQLGKTTGLLNEELTLKTPLVNKIEKVITAFSCVVLVFSLIGFIANYIRGAEKFSSFMVIANFAVCVVSNGLVIGVYTNLNKSISRLYKENLLVKRLTTMEELGAVDTLCIDKLGVITESKMHVEDVWINNRNDYQVGRNPNFITLCNAMLLCNNAELRYDDDRITAIGTNYEVALLNYGLYLGYNKDKLEGLFPRVNEFYFDRDRKVMSTINTVGEKSVVFLKGDFLRVLSKCTSVLDEGKAVPLTESGKQKLIHEYQKFISKGNLVMAFANKEYKGDVYTARLEEVESDLTFIGMTAVMPRLKEDVKSSLNKLTKNGIKVVITTSDDAEVTYATALDLGIIKNKLQMLTGDQLTRLTDTELKSIINKYSVFAEILPEQKMRVIKALNASGRKVCVTGDNVTDVGAMAVADVSIGLGVQASELVKEKAEIVLMDNNLDHLVDGIAESRRANTNILKSLQYVFSSTIAEITTLFVILVVMGKTFFSPALLLWLNFFNGLFPCLGLGEEKCKTLTYTPIKKNLLDNTQWFNVGMYGVLQALIVLAVYFTGSYYYDIDPAVVVSLCFVVLDFLQLFHAFNMKNPEKSLFTSNPFGNSKLNINAFICMLVSFGFACLPIPLLQDNLGVTQVTVVSWLACVGVAFIIIPLAEIVKMFLRTYLEHNSKKGAR